MDIVVNEFFKAYCNRGMNVVYTERIPKDMLAGPVNSSGWVTWKLTEGKLSVRDYEEIEKEFRVKLPPSFIDWHRSYFFLDADCSLIRLPESWPTEPLEVIKSNLTCYAELIEEGLIAFGWDGNDAGPLVFDTSYNSPLNEYPVKVYDHASGELSEVIFSSFSKLLQCMTHFLNMAEHKKNFETIPDFYLIDSEGAGTRDGRAYWNSWVKMLKANYEEFGY